MRYALWMTALALTASCTSPPTELRLEIHSNLPVPEELERVRVTVDARTIGDRLQLREIVLEDAGELPLRFPVVHAGGPLGPLSIRVVGMRASEVVAGQDMTLSFIAGRSVLVPVELSSACRDVRCPMDHVCADGACLPTGGPDGGTVERDAGAPDAGGRDAGPGEDAGRACPEVRECADRCDCEDTTCGCALQCREGEDCEAHCDADCEVRARGVSNLHVHCRGASCRIDARDVSNTEHVRCERGADCEVDCEGASNCHVECKSGSACLVRCAGASNCDVRDCGDLDEDVDEGGGDLRRCAGDVLVCRRDCP